MSEEQNINKPQNPTFGNLLLAAGALKWIQREYEINFSPSDYFKAQTQLKEQDERKDDIILLKVDYSITQGKAKITDKVCTCR